MHARSLLLACGAVAAASALAGCGSSQSTTPTRSSSRRHRSTAVTAFGARATTPTANVVYEWGRYGGADPGGTSGHGPDNHGWSPTYGGWYRGGPSHVVRTPTPVAGIDGTIRQVASSNSDGYGLTASGRVYAWGAGAQGELGDGNTPTLSRRAVRVHLPAGIVIERLALSTTPVAGSSAAGSATSGSSATAPAADLCRAVGRSRSWAYPQTGSRR